MNEEKIKELYGINYVRLLAEYSGFYVTIPGQDYGTDLHIEEMHHLETGEYIPSGKILSLQVKCTTEESVTNTGDYLKFDLPVRNYNLLIQRQYYTETFRRYSPYILVTVVLPKNKADWIKEIEIGKTNLNVKAYWYKPSSGNQVSKNKSSKRIKIPLENFVNLELYPKLFKLLWLKNQNL